MSNWKEYKLSDIADIIGGGTPSTSEPAFWNGNIPWLTPRDLTGYTKTYIGQGERSITENGLSNSSARILPKGSVLITSRAPIGYVAIAENAVCTNQGFKSLVLDNSKAKNRFIYYWVKNNVEYLQSIGTGTTFMEISGSTLRDVSIMLPPIEEQERIAEVLSSLDDKIDLLHRQNTTLEALAQTYFRQWFVEDASEDWETVRLGDILETIESGSRPKGGIDQNLQKGIPSLGAESINGLGVYDFSKTKYVTPEFFSNMRRGIVKNRDVLIYKDGAYVGKKGMFGNDFPFKEYAINEHVFILKTNENASQNFLYFALREEDLAQLNSNSAQPGLNQQSMLTYEIVLPPIKLIQDFDAIVDPLINKIFANANQIKALQQLRDTLLPKLITGEVEVKK